jgi:hypothetical protein
MVTCNRHVVTPLDSHFYQKYVIFDDFHCLLFLGSANVFRLTVIALALRVLADVFSTDSKRVIDFRVNMASTRIAWGPAMYALQL